MTITKTTESDTDTDCRYITMAGRYILTCHFLKGKLYVKTIRSYTRRDEKSRSNVREKRHILRRTYA